MRRTKLYPLLGSCVRVRRHEGERERAHDPRQSIEERYPTRERYLELVQDAVAALVKDHYLLAEDLPGLVEHAGESTGTYSCTARRRLTQ